MGQGRIAVVRQGRHIQPWVQHQAVQGGVSALEQRILSSGDEASFGQQVQLGLFDTALAIDHEVAGQQGPKGQKRRQQQHDQAPAQTQAAAKSHDESR